MSSGSLTERRAVILWGRSVGLARQRGDRERSVLELRGVCVSEPERGGICLRTCVWLSVYVCICVCCVTAASKGKGEGNN